MEPRVRMLQSALEADLSVSQFERMLYLRLGLILANLNGMQFVTKLSILSVLFLLQHATICDVRKVKGLLASFSTGTRCDMLQVLNCWTYELKSFPVLHWSMGCKSSIHWFSSTLVWAWCKNAEQSCISVSKHIHIQSNVTYNSPACSEFVLGCPFSWTQPEYFHREVVERNPDHIQG